ncbi:SURF1-like protein [Actinorhabdospora filicis]|uniref:SURF1-like protein n=1 Tax=Actinorhabdospora filicis TaxID=1785913 RepID=A0A9W6SIC9_9ACTN|nr:SURF1 family protein [Actinorhabdospora filicis]GLZ76044.1 SURF1-like protein [Actinorhabdospora filicis]
MSSTGYRFLATPRWLGIIVGGIAAVILCAFLAQWQYGRYEERAEANDRVAHGAEAAPRPLTEVMPGGRLAKDDQWTHATATGSYDPAKQVFLRGRTVNGSTGWEVVVPFTLTDGTVVLVDRGWVEPADGMKPPTVPAPPSGTVTLTGRVRPAETAVGEVAVKDGVLQGRRVNPEQIAAQVALPLLTGGYLTPDEPDQGFTGLPVPQERSWQNFAYAYQWWLFAGLIPIGLVILARKEARGDKRTARIGDRADEDESVPSAV